MKINAFGLLKLFGGSQSCGMLFSYNWLEKDGYKY